MARTTEDQLALERLGTTERQGSVSYRKELSARAPEIVAIDQASGLALGPDGYFHPIEVDGRGRLRASDSSELSLQEEQLRETRAVRIGIEWLLRANGINVDLLAQATA